MKNENRIPWITLLFATVALLVFAAGPAAFEGLVWRADWARSGQFWRVLTGHFAHTSGSHLLWDLGAFVVLGAYVERQGGRALLVLLGATMLLTEVALRLSGRFELYCGLSGLDMALFASAAFQLLRKGRLEKDGLLKGVGAASLALAAGKVGWEIFAGSPVFVSDLQAGFSVAAEAHLAGLAGAILAKVLLTAYQLVGFRFCHVTRPSS